VPQIEVIFDLDANGILNVTAKDKATGKSQNITIKDSSGLSKEDIERMKSEAEAHSAEDRKQKELIDLRNQSDTTIYSVEKTLRDAGDKVPADIKKGVEEKIEAVKKVKDGSDEAALKKALDELSQEIQKIGSEMYKQEKATEKEVTEEPELKDKGEETIKGEFEEGGEKK
jgi:molecular chaperone DnaK